MKFSEFFVKTLREPPKDEESVNARLLEQAGFVRKAAAGVYSFLPLGWRVLSKIENIVREEMDKIGAELLMPALHPKENWIKTERWNALDVLFKVKSQHGHEYALGPTHEEIVVPLMRSAINSYRDLPLAVYQIQTKFRDEPRAKGGLLRGREFRMKDLYSFHQNENDLENYYTNCAIPAYKKIFKRLGLNAIVTEASGGTFSKFSHEFQVEIENGEDTVYVCAKCGLAKNKEILEEGVGCTVCGKTTWRETTASEVGNIFKLKTKFSDSFQLTYRDNEGKELPVVMGCYGIGTSRLMGVLVEKFHDDKGITWQEAVAPFKAHLISLYESREADEIYEEIGKDLVLYDNRSLVKTTAGEKFMDADLIGIPLRIVVSADTISKGKIEIKRRGEDEAELISKEELFKMLKSK